MARRYDPRSNLYAIGTALLAEAITVRNWWKVEGYSYPELVRAFGPEALARGVRLALAAGEDVPAEVLGLCSIGG